MVSSVADLEALPVGTTIEVRGRRTFTWNRTERGWENDGAVLTSDYFSGHITQGQVFNPATSGPTVGSFWTYNEYVYFVTALPEGSTRVQALQFPINYPEEAAQESNPMRRHFGGAYRRSTPEEISAVATPARFAEALLAQITVTAERDQRAQEVRSLKNRPDPSIFQPMVDAVAAGLAEAQRAMQQMNDTLRNGQTEF